MLAASPNDIPERPLSVFEVSSWLGYDPATVRRLIRTGKLKATKVGGQWRITRGALLQLIEDEVAS